jgi:serine/threonine-protein kinase
LPCELAVKVLHRSLQGDDLALARFRQEAEITSALRHPHIVQMFDFKVTEEGVPYLVMELLDGRPLSAEMATRELFEPRAVLRIVEQLARALQYAHDNGVVHRDLKPDNVILLSVGGRDDFVKLVDFGISQASWRTRLTGEPTVAGTPRYMAPEQANGLRNEIDHRADQFSLAAIAYRLLTGREPFDGDDALAVLYQVVHAEAEAPSALAPWLATNVDDVIGRAMSKRAADRYPSIEAFAQALREAMANDTEPSVRAATSPRASEPAESADPEPPVADHHLTLRVIRKTRQRARTIVLALSAAVAFAWFLPPTRAETRRAWHSLRTDALKMIQAAAPRSQEPSRSGVASIP